MSKAILAPIIAIFLLFSSFVPSIIHAQTKDTSIQDQRAALEAELAQLQTEIAQKEAELKNQQKQTGTLKKDVQLLTSQIETAKLKIRQKIITINNLSQEIKVKAGTIVDLQNQINRSHDSLAQLVKRTNEIDQKGAAYVLLSSDSVTDFYKDLDDFLAVKQSLYASVNKIREVKSVTEKQRKDLQSKQAQEEDAKNTLNSQKQIVEQSEAEKKKLLSISQDKEKEYQAILAERQRKVNEIKTKLFGFAGGTAAIKFGEAYNYAKLASAQTGVSPAFLLAILTQESNLGKNVGQCYLTDTETGAGVNKNTGKTYPNVMKPTRDIGPFLEVTSTLGLDPLRSIVSCPIVSNVYWNSGSFGPSQFLPSTWKLFIPRLQNILGRYPNPWAPGDSFMASGLYLAELGGSGDNTAAQTRAACRYNGGGSSCYYGRSVMAIMRSIQSDIDYLETYGVSRR